MEMDTQAPKREASKKPPVILAEIEAKISSLDGIATADAFALGRMVQEYGQACSGEASSSILGPMLEAMVRPRAPKPPTMPWENDGR
jgi:hypothetical protein